MNKHWWAGESAIVDPDFDDEWGDVTLLQHEVETDGVIPLHPNANRIKYDPVPLHTRVYNDGTVGELKKREWAEHIRQYHRHELEEQQQQLTEQQRQLEAEPMEEPPVQYDAPSSLPPWPWHHDLLRNMFNGQPLLPGMGRIWRDYVMVRKDDIDGWVASDPIRANFPRVWADDQLIIFQLR